LVRLCDDDLLQRTEQVVKDGGTVHEDSLGDAYEMALVGASGESITKRIMDTREGERYQPKGRWRSRRRPRTQ